MNDEAGRPNSWTILAVACVRVFQYKPTMPWLLKLILHVIAVCEAPEYHHLEEIGCISLRSLIPIIFILQISMTRVKARLAMNISLRYVNASR